jgi:meiotic recombination protein SPO11
VRKGIHITKRDLFYTDVKLFEKQTEVGFFTHTHTHTPVHNCTHVIQLSLSPAQSDAVLDDVACMIGCTRTSLNVVASDKVTLFTSLTLSTLLTLVSSLSLHTGSCRWTRDL